MFVRCTAKKTCCFPGGLCLQLRLLWAIKLKPVYSSNHHTEVLKLGNTLRLSPKSSPAMTSRKMRPLLPSWRGSNTWNLRRRRSEWSWNLFLNVVLIWRLLNLCSLFFDYACDSAIRQEEPDDDEDKPKKRPKPKASLLEEAEEQPPAELSWWSRHHFCGYDLSTFDGLGG